MNAIKELEREQLRTDVPELAPGDTVRVSVKVVEGSRERIQVFEGTVMRMRGGGLNRAITVRRIASGVGVEMRGPVDENVGPTRVDAARFECLPHPGKTLAKTEGEVELGIGAAAGESQCGPDLCGGGIPAQLGFVDELSAFHVVGDRCHRGVDLRLVVGGHALVRTQHDDPVMTRDPIDVDRGEEPGECWAGFHPIETRRDPFHMVEHVFDDIGRV